MTRREIFKEVLATYKPKWWNVDETALPIMHKLRMLTDMMFVWPNKFEQKDIVKVRSFHRFLEKKGYW